MPFRMVIDNKHISDSFKLRLKICQDCGTVKLYFTLVCVHNFKIINLQFLIVFLYRLKIVKDKVL